MAPATAAEKIAKAVIRKLQWETINPTLETRDGREFDLSDLTAAQRALGTKISKQVCYDGDAECVVFVGGIDVMKTFPVLMVDQDSFLNEGDVRGLSLANDERAAAGWKTKNPPHEANIRWDVKITPSGELHIGCKRFSFDYWETRGRDIIKDYFTYEYDTVNVPPYDILAAFLPLARKFIATHTPPSPAPPGIGDIREMLLTRMGLPLIRPKKTAKKKTVKKKKTAKKKK